MSKDGAEHYGVAGGGCACGWQNAGFSNWLRTLHMYANIPEFRQLVDEYGWPKDS